jgi:transposase-like protein
MPRGIKTDKDTILQRLQQVRGAVASGKSISEARRDAGVTPSNYARWNKRFGHLLGTQPSHPKKTVRGLRPTTASRGHVGDNGRGPVPSHSVRPVSERRRKAEPEVEELRRIIVDQAVQIARLQRASHQ